MKKILNLMLLAALSGMVIFSCKKDDNSSTNNGSTTKTTYTSGAYILCKGRPGFNEGDISFVYTDTSQILRDLLLKNNGRHITGEPVSLYQINSKFYILSNNPSRIMVFNNASIAKSDSVDFSMPVTEVFYTGSSRALVSLAGTSNYFFANLNTEVDTLVDNVATTFIPGAVYYHNGYYFAATRTEGVDKKVNVLKASDYSLVKSITVGVEPIAFAVDMGGSVWVYCAGTPDNDGLVRNASLDVIDTKSLLRRTMKLPEQKAITHKNVLTANSTGDTIFFVNNGLKAMRYNSASVPGTNFAGFRNTAGFDRNPYTKALWLYTLDNGSVTDSIKIYNAKGVLDTIVTVGYEPMNAVFVQ